MAARAWLAPSAQQLFLLYSLFFSQGKQIM
jgi:hypothetical protein